MNSKVQHAREMRQEPTDAESLLWRHLRWRQLGYKFRRQHPLDEYIVDFCCPQARLVIELDGGQHAMNRAADEERGAVLAGRGYRTLRFWNHDVLYNLDGVLATIIAALERSP